MREWIAKSNKRRCQKGQKGGVAGHREPSGGIGSRSGEIDGEAREGIDGGGGEREAEMVGGEHFVDQHKTDAIAAGACGEKWGEKPGGDFLGNAVAIVGDNERGVETGRNLDSHMSRGVGGVLRCTLGTILDDIDENLLHQHGVEIKADREVRQIDAETYTPRRAEAFEQGNFAGHKCNDVGGSGLRRRNAYCLCEAGDERCRLRRAIGACVQHGDEVVAKFGIIGEDVGDGGEGGGN